MKYLLALLLLCYSPVWAEDWDDLYEGEKKVYGSEKSEKFPVNALFMQVEKWDQHYGLKILWLYYHKDYPKYNSTDLFPLYSRLNSKIDDRERMRFLNYTYRKQNQVVDRSIFPFAFWGYNPKRNSSYQGVFPLYYKKNREGSKRKTDEFAFVPFPFYSENEEKTSEGKTYHSYANYSLLHGKMSSGIKDSGRRENYYWFPILPLAGWYNDRDKEWGNYLFPIYGHFREDLAASKKNVWGFSPLALYYSNSKYKEKGTGEWLEDRFHFSLIHGTSSTGNRADGSAEEVSYWFPIVPLLQYSKDQNSSSNYAFPIYYYSNRDDKFEKEKVFGFSLFPFYYSSKSLAIHTDSTHKEDFHWSLLHYRSKEYDVGEFHEEYHRSSWGFPIIPFLFTSSDGRFTGSKRRLLTLISWENDAQGSTKAYAFQPFFSYEKNKHFSIPLLLMNKDLSQPDKVAGKTFIPLALYYHKWDHKEDTTFFATYYSHEEKLNKEEFTTLFPVYWKSRSEEKDWSFIVPFYLNYNDKENDYHINLLWFSNSETGVLSPYLTGGQDEDKWYLDSEFTVLYYLASFSFRKSIDKPQYLRKQTARIASFETQKQKEKEEKRKARWKEMAKKKARENPKLAKKRDFTREDSLSFAGYSALFGLISYEKADTKRHFRLLPFSWLTWDEASDEKIIIVPPFPPIAVWYETEDISYNVFFPFYGRQRDEDSEITSYLLNFYIRESYKEEKLEETSVLWPLANFYRSETSSGQRVLPFYLHKNVIEKDKTVTSNYSLFSYYNNETHKNGNQYKSFYFWPLLIAYNKDKYKYKEKESEEMTLWATPFFYRNSNEHKVRTNFLWFTDWKFRKHKQRKDELKYLLVFPFYYAPGSFHIIPIMWNKKNTNGFKSFFLVNYLEVTDKKYYNNFATLIKFQKNRDDQYLHFSGLWDFLWNFKRHGDGKWKELSLGWYLGLGYHETNFYHATPLLMYKSKSDGFWNFTLGNYMRNNSQRFYDNFLFLVEYEKSKKTKQMQFRSLWGWLWNFDKRSNGHWKEATVLSWLGGGYRQSGDTHSYQLTPLFLYKAKPKGYMNWLLGNYTRSSPQKFYNNFLFLYEYDLNRIKQESQHNLLFSSIHYHNHSQDFLFKGFAGILWKFHKTQEWNDSRVLWLGYGKTPQKQSYNFFPVFYRSKRRWETTHIWGPVLIYANFTKKRDLQLGALGAAYWHYQNKLDKEYSTYILLGSLFRSYSKKERGYHTMGSMWGWLWEYQYETETQFRKFSVLKLFSFGKDKRGRTKIMGIRF